MDGRNAQQEELASGSAKATDEASQSNAKPAEANAASPNDDVASGSAKATDAASQSNAKPAEDMANQEKVVKISTIIAKYAINDNMCDEAVNSLLALIGAKVPGMPKDAQSVKAYYPADQM